MSLQSMADGTCLGGSATFLIFLVPDRETLLVGIRTDPPGSALELLARSPVAA